MGLMLTHLACPPLSPCQPQRARSRVPAAVHSVCTGERHRRAHVHPRPLQPRPLAVLGVGPEHPGPPSGPRKYICGSGVTVTWLLCDPLPFSNVLKVPHAKNLGENAVIAFSTKCTPDRAICGGIRH
jgi:hypothetical protein